VTNEPARIAVPGFHQWDSAFNETTGLLYLPTPNDNAITVIDTRTGVVSMVGTGSVPMAAAVNDVTNRAVAVDPVSNMIYVANRLSDRVTVIDGRTNGAVQR
jgi:DNA-binding beta-propeller fold protein YncE